MQKSLRQKVTIYFQQNLFYSKQFASETVDNVILENLKNE